MKSAAIRGSARDVVTDERIAVGLDLMGASVPTMLQLLYPSLYAVHDPQGDWGKPRTDGRHAPTPLPSADERAMHGVLTRDRSQRREDDERLCLQSNFCDLF